MMEGLFLVIVVVENYIRYVLNYFTHLHIVTYSLYRKRHFPEVKFLSYKDRKRILVSGLFYCTSVITKYFHGETKYTRTGWAPFGRI